MPCRRSAKPPSIFYLNARAFWRNIPAHVWTYKLGGYQVLKKWLSYREREILGRMLTPEDVQHFADTARRIGSDRGGSCRVVRVTPSSPW